uniref:Uncharacterized protein n=1 Tax=Candidatus Kentrum sp. LFY TaxID=2126342 RepID=A0A450UYY3_9GAMM|nr:MAG: hypothetical protein BECKLFY1418B_GA0070995_11083 [Candidatus Kentron sp. LFY]
MTPILLTIGLAVVGLLAGWLKCVEPGGENLPGIKRVTKAGWLVLILLVALTTITSLLSQRDSDAARFREEKKQAQIDSLESELGQANKTIFSLKEKFELQTEIVQGTALVNAWIQAANAAKVRLQESIQGLRGYLPFVKSDDKNQLSLHFSTIDLASEIFANAVGVPNVLDTDVKLIKSEARSYLLFFGSKTKPEFQEKGCKQKIARIDKLIKELDMEISGLIAKKQPPYIDLLLIEQLMKKSDAKIDRFISK